MKKMHQKLVRIPVLIFMLYIMYILYPKTEKRLGKNHDNIQITVYFSSVHRLECGDASSARRIWKSKCLLCPNGRIESYVIISHR
jgi:hypothetical protein